MKRCLVDVNVLLALLVRHHEHHRVARKWFDEVQAGEALLCRVVQIAVTRLLGNGSIMGHYAIPAGEAWRLIAELLQDERLEFVQEPREIDSVLPSLLNHPVPTSRLVGDAYLAAFSIAARYRLVTLDRGFRQFARVELDLLPR